MGNILKQPSMCFGCVQNPINRHWGRGMYEVPVFIPYIFNVYSLVMLNTTSLAAVCATVI